MTTITPDMKYTNVEKYVDTDTPAGTVKAVKENGEEYIQIKANPLLADMWNTGMDANKVSLAFGLNLGQKLTSGKYILSFEAYRNANIESVGAAGSTPGHLRMGASTMAGLQTDNASFAGAFQRFQDMRDSQYVNRAHRVLPAGAADGQELDYDAMSWAEPRDPLAPEKGGDYLMPGTWYKYRVEFDLDAGTFRIYINGDLMQRTVDGVTTTDFKGLKEIQSLLFGYRALGKYWTEARLKNVRFRDARIPSDDEEEEIPGLQMEGVQKADLDSLPDGYTFPEADSLTEIGFGTSIGELDGKPTGAVDVVKEGEDSYIRLVSYPQTQDIWAPAIDQQGAAVNFGLVLPQTISAGKYVLRFDIWRNSDESSLTATDNVTPGNMRLGGITTNENLAATNYTYAGPLMRWETLIPTAHVKREHKIWTAKAVDYTDLDVSAMNWAEPEGENNGPYLQPKTWYRYEVRFDLDAGTYQLYINGQQMQAFSEDGSGIPIIDFAGFQEMRSVVFGFSSLGAYANEARIRNLSFSNASELLEPLPLLDNEQPEEDPYTVGDGQTRPVDPDKDPDEDDQNDSSGDQNGNGDRDEIPHTGVGLPLAGLAMVCLSGLAVMVLCRRRHRRTS